MYVFANVMFYLLSSNNIRTKKRGQKIDYIVLDTVFTLQCLLWGFLCL